MDTYGFIILKAMAQWSRTYPFMMSLQTISFNYSSISEDEGKNSSSSVGISESPKQSKNSNVGDTDYGVISN